MAELGQGSHSLPPRERGQVRAAQWTYGSSVSGIPLVGYGQRRQHKTLMIAGMHGEEAVTVACLSRALRMTSPDRLDANVVLSVNPDGALMGTRGNAHGVDLNRNFPSADWRAGEFLHRWHGDEERVVLLSGGDLPASEPETSALVSLVGALEPSAVIDIHAPLGAVVDLHPDRFTNALVARLGCRLSAPERLSSTGMAGTYFRERAVRYVNIELDGDSLFAATRRVTPVLADLLQAPIEEWPSR